MAIFSVQIADEDIDRVLNAVAANYNRPEMVPNPEYAGPMVPNPDFDPTQEESETNPSEVENPEPSLLENPESKAVFANRMVRQFLSEHVIAYEKRLARQEAEQAANVSITINDPQL
jgi:hypothetical protein